VHFNFLTAVKNEFYYLTFFSQIVAEELSGSNEVAHLTFRGQHLDKKVSRLRGSWMNLLITFD